MKIWYLYEKVPPESSANISQIKIKMVEFFFYILYIYKALLLLLDHIVYEFNVLDTD